MEFLEVEGKDQEEIVFDVFNLNDLQENIFEELREKQLTVKEIAEEVERNRSTVQRALQDMLDKDLLMREGKTDKTVYYVYTTLPMEEIKSIACDTLESWHEMVQQKLNN